jgi:NRPS condensation-like uncharacterized protein
MTGDRYPVHPFDFFSDLLSSFSNQMIHLVMIPGSRLDPVLLKKAVMAATEAEPITRYRLVLEEDTLWWELLPVVNADEQVIVLSSPYPWGILHDALFQKIDPYHGPITRVILIQAESGDTNDILICSSHHTAMDGYGLKDLASLIMQYYRIFSSGKPEVIMPGGMDQRLLPRVSSLVVPPGNDPAEATIDWPCHLTVPVQSLEKGRSTYSLLYLSDERGAWITTTRKEWGVTLNDLIIAVVARACANLAEGNGDQVVSLLVTVDLRRSLSIIPARSVANYATAIFLPIPVNPDESLKDTALRTKSLMDSMKSGFLGLDGAREAERLYDLGHEAAIREIEGRWEENVRAGKRTPLFSNTGIITPESIHPGIPIRQAFFFSR